MKNTDEKILLMGLSNSGKTSILQYLQGTRNLPAFGGIKPTVKINRVLFQAVENDRTVWDFGGQKVYIKRYLKDFYDHLSGTTQILFVIDIQDEEKYGPALSYLGKIVNLLQTQDEGIEFIIYLHKYDPDISRTHPHITEEKISKLIEQIHRLFPPQFEHSIFKTSIYATMQKLPVIK